MDGKVSWSLWMKLPVRIIMCSESSYWASVARHHIASRLLLDGTDMDFENQVLKSEISFDCYAQIKTLQKDLSSF